MWCCEVLDTSDVERIADKEDSKNNEEHAY